MNKDCAQCKYWSVKKYNKIFKNDWQNIRGYCSQIGIYPRFDFSCDKFKKSFKLTLIQLLYKIKS